MSWTKVSDKRWERPLDGLEDYFVITGNITSGICNGREHYVIFSALKLELDSADAEAALKRAWKQFRYEQPQIATIAEDGKKVYQIPDAEGLSQWLSETFIVSSAASADELHQDVTDQPLKQATLYWLPKTSELVFRAHHHTIDGTGTLLFWDAFLGMLASPAEDKDVQFGDETSRLAPAMREILGFAAEPTEEKGKKATDLLMSWLSLVPGLGPVSKLGSSPVAKCNNKEMIFPEKTSAALVKACKDKGFTVTSAVHAAYIMALVKHASPDSKTSEYVAMNQFNLRSYLPEPYNTKNYATSVYYTPFPYKLELPSTFTDAAKSLNEHYKSAFSPGSENLELKDHYMRSMCGIISSPEFLTAPAPRDALVSSLGIAEKYVQHEYGSGVKVKDLRVGVDVVMGMSLMFIYTWADQLRLTYCFNEGYEEEKDIQTYLEEMQKILVEELLA